MFDFVFGIHKKHKKNKKLRNNMRAKSQTLSELRESLTMANSDLFKVITDFGCKLKYESG